MFPGQCFEEYRVTQNNFIVDKILKFEVKDDNFILFYSKD